MACGGGATAYDIQLVKTSNSSGVFQTAKRYADDGWDWIDSHSASSGTSYYLRWRGYHYEAGGWWKTAAPCQGVQARSI